MMGLTTNPSTNAAFCCWSRFRNILYFQNNKKTKIKVISSQLPSWLIFVTKFALNAPARYIIDSFGSDHFVGVRFIGYCEALIQNDVINLVIKTLTK